MKIRKYLERCKPIHLLIYIMGVIVGYMAGYHQHMYCTNDANKAYLSTNNHPEPWDILPDDEDYKEDE